MRRVPALAAVAAGLLAVAGCTGDPARPASAPPSATGSGSAGASTSVPAAARATPSATPVDVAANAQVCADANAAAADVTKVFNDKIAAIEVAAAKGDQTAMVNAAEVIQKKFVTLSSSLTTLSKKPVESDVKAALTGAAAALKEISSESYPGTTEDTQKRLADLAKVFATVCS